MNKIDLVEAAYLKKDLPEFRPGDTLRVYVRIKEEDKVRLQAYEGIVIAKQGRGINLSFTVRKLSYGEGVQRTFLLHSPAIERIEVLKTGKARRAKLYYLKERMGKQATVV